MEPTAIMSLLLLLLSSYIVAAAATEDSNNSMLLLNPSPSSEDSVSDFRSVGYEELRPRMDEVRKGIFLK